MISDQMNRLPSFVGQQVQVEHVFYGSLQTDVAELLEITPFRNIVFGCQGVPFIGYGSAIRKITFAATGEVIFENPHIKADYDIRKEDQRFELIRASFGEAIADGQMEEARSEREKSEKMVADLDHKAKEKSPLLVEAGVPFVKPELVEEWCEYARKNTQDGYSAAVIEGTIAGLKALAEGKSPEDSERQCTAAETGYQMGAVASGLYHFSPRGDEFRLHWNRQYLSPEEATKAAGVVNPAILTIGG